MSERIAVVTALFGKTDVLRPPPRGNFETLCATDGPCPSGWRRLVLAPSHRGLPPRRRARAVKVLAHLYTNAELVLWYDATFSLTSDPTAWVRRMLTGADFATFKHSKRNCVYDEARVVIERGLDDRRVVEQQVKRYREARYPSRAGLFETGIVLRRMTPSVRALCEMWWSEIVKGSKRDQISLPFAVRKSRLNVKILPGDVRHQAIVKFRGHLKPSFRPVLVIGTGRCGTQTAARYLQLAGLDVRHEAEGRDGTSAWHRSFNTSVTPRGDRLPQVEYRTVLHIIRDPLLTIASWQTMLDHSLTFVTKHLNIDPSWSKLRIALHHWVLSNERCAQLAEWSFRVEDLPRVLPELCRRVGVSVPKISGVVRENRRQHGIISWADLDAEDPVMAGRARELAKKFGYPTK